MNKQIEDYMNWLSSAILEAEEQAEIFTKAEWFGSSAQSSSMAVAYKIALDKLMLLLNEQPKAITEDAHFRKHDVDGRAESESVTHTESSCASSSETAAVDGHEQTKKFCELTGKFY